MYAMNGEKYYILFLDAYSKFTWLYLLHSKSQALPAFKLLVENETSLKIKTIQTDNAKKFHCFKYFINNMVCNTVSLVHIHMSKMVPLKGSVAI